MCLYSTKQLPKKSISDIKCYKVFRIGDGIIEEKGALYSPFTDTKVRVKIGSDTENVFIAENIKDELPYTSYDRGKYEIGAGYIHSYRYFSDAEEAITSGVFTPPFHPVDNLVIYECVIPKGTEYYSGYTYGRFVTTYASYASRLIKIIKRIYF